METTVPVFFQVVIIIPTDGHRRLDLFFSGRNYVKIGFGGKVTTEKKNVQSSGQLCFSVGSNYNRKKIMTGKKNVQSSGHQLETGKNYVRKKRYIHL